MTEEKKQKLRQLLHEALENLEIRLSSANRPQLPPIINTDEYRHILQQDWILGSDDNFSSPVLRYEPYIVDESTKLKLLDFVREEFASFIHEDQIQSAYFFMGGGSPNGYPLDFLLKQLLKIAIAFGEVRATSDFDRCTENTSGSFEYRAILEGIKVENEITLFEGMQIVPLPDSTSELRRYLPLDFDLHVRLQDFLGKALLVINTSVSPIFCKPFPEVFRKEFHPDHLPFRAEVTGGKFPNFKEYDFYEKFCQVLSLVCNSAVQISLQWRSLAKYELFNLGSLAVGQVGWRTDVGLFTNSAVAGETQVDKATHLYEDLVKLDSNVREKLRIPIDRWIKSKTSQTAVDKMIDLGIAFEAIYLSDISETTELSFRLRLRASWFLGKNQAHRQELMKDLSKIYEWRSKAVHTGKLPNKKKKTCFTPEEVEAFITNTQNLCRDSIMKILEDGEFPDWNSLILG